MLSNAKQLCFISLLLAISVSSQNCQSFPEATDLHFDFDNETAFLSAPGFVKDLTISASWIELPLEWVSTRHENATGTVEQHGKTAAKPRFLELNKPMTVRLPGTGAWAGYNESESFSVNNVDFDEFKRYFADGGAGLVIDLENYSTLDLVLNRPGGNETTYTAEPMKFFKTTGSKVALAVFHEVEMTITIPSANVLSISMDREMAEENFVWTATERMATEGISFGGEVHNRTMEMGPNQCLEMTTTPYVPTSSPTPTSGANARRSGFPTAALTMLVAAALVALR